MKKITFFEGLAFTLAIALITFFIVGAALIFRRDTKAYNNAMRYCEENDVECFSKKGSYAFVFSDCSIIGADVMAKYYKD